MRAAKSDLQAEINQVETNLNRDIDKVASDLRVLDGDMDEKVDNLKDVLSRDINKNADDIEDVDNILVN